MAMQVLSHISAQSWHVFMKHSTNLHYYGVSTINEAGNIQWPNEKYLNFGVEQITTIVTSLQILVTCIPICTITILQPNTFSELPTDLDSP